MQQSSVGEPGLGVPEHEIGHRLVRPLLQAGGAGQFQRHREHVGAGAEEQPLAKVEDAAVAPAERHRDAEDAVHQELGDPVQPEFLQHQRRQQDQGDERDVGGTVERALDGHASAVLSVWHGTDAAISLISRHGQWATFVASPTRKLAVRDAVPAGLGS